MTAQDAYITGVLTALAGLFLGWWVDRSLAAATADDVPPRG
jgi:hypothetical protein